MKPTIQLHTDRHCENSDDDDDDDDSVFELYTIGYRCFSCGIVFEYACRCLHLLYRYIYTIGILKK